MKRNTDTASPSQQMGFEAGIHWAQCHAEEGELERLQWIWGIIGADEWNEVFHTEAGCLAGRFFSIIKGVEFVSCEDSVDFWDDAISGHLDDLHGNIEMNEILIGFMDGALAVTFESPDNH